MKSDRSIWVVFGLILAGVAVGGTVPVDSATRVTRNGDNAVVGPVIITRAAESGGVFETASTLCAALGTADKAGNWWCLQGNGTMATGSNLTLAPESLVPVVYSWPVLPSGSGSTMENQSLIVAAQRFYRSPSTSIPTDTSFTACHLGTVDLATGATPWAPTESVIEFGDNANSDFNVFASEPASANGTGVTCLGGECVNAVNSVRTVNAVPILRCGIFNSGVGTTACSYTQGAAGSSASCTTVASALTSIPGPNRWNVGRTNGWSGMLRGAFVSYKVLSTADITRIGAAVLPPKPAGMNFARASPETCEGPDGKAVRVPNNMPCMANNLAIVYPAAATNRSTSIFAATSITNNTLNVVQGIFGTKIATRNDIAATSGTTQQGMYIQNTNVGVSLVRTCSAYVGASDPARDIDICFHNRNFFGDDRDWDCQLCTVAQEPARSRCSMTGNTSVQQSECAIGNLSRWITGNPARAAYSVSISAPQMEDTATLTPYVPTYTVDEAEPETRAAATCTGTGCPP